MTRPQLDTQPARLQKHCVDAGFADIEIIIDLASGLNYRKKGLQRLLQEILRGRVAYAFRAALRKMPATARSEVLPGRRRVDPDQSGRHVDHRCGEGCIPTRLECACCRSGVIARRRQKLTERLPRAGTATRVPVRCGHHALELPARKSRDSSVAAWRSVQRCGARALARHAGRFAAPECERHPWRRRSRRPPQKGRPFALRRQSA
ncbi:MerR family transcriptional regulator [Paraburkholderia hospita]|uniref:MerR family transcriptional regulator n=1 Tax=Paraburkholderia hospita TaxID=169430 RepID=A0ABN0FTN9_9BURK|nr:MerR family transcriptional regulator [Paraburkholderia hospita]